MLIEALRLQDFRNIEEAFIKPHPRFNIFWGHNGHGKTNLLESIYLLSAVKSFRPQTNNDLIRFTQATAELEAKVDRGGAERIVRLNINPKGKSVFLNDQKVRNLRDFFGSINVVMFGPEDVRLLKGSPSARRKFIDRAIFNAYPGYAFVTQQYEEVLKQRNALLKDGRVDPVLLETYNDQFVQFGSEIVFRRLEFLERFLPTLQSTFREIFDASFEASLYYDSDWLGNQTTMEDIAHSLEHSLLRTREEERDRRHTRVGPHRDDLSAELNGRNLKSFGSQGQHRGFVLAMKIAEIKFLKERFHFSPILLLDDVSSELDRDRNRFLFEYIRNGMDGQVFITTTHRDHILIDDDLASFAISDGRIAPD